jgi:hypothetical protein
MSEPIAMVRFEPTPKFPLSRARESIARARIPTVKNFLTGWQRPRPNSNLIGRAEPHHCSMTPMGQPLPKIA